MSLQNMKTKFKWVLEKDSFSNQYIYTFQLKAIGSKQHGSILDLFRTPNIRKRTFIMCLNW